MKFVIAENGIICNVIVADDIETARACAGDRDVFAIDDPRVADLQQPEENP